MPDSFCKVPITYPFTEQISEYHHGASERGLLCSGVAQSVRSNRSVFSQPSFAPL